MVDTTGNLYDYDGTPETVGNYTWPYYTYWPYCDQLYEEKKEICEKINKILDKVLELLDND